jgi:hypothetical protein
MGFILDFFNTRLLDLTHSNFAAVLGLIGVLFYVPSYCMKTIIPLRIAGVVGDSFLLAYGYLCPSYTTLVLYMLVLPINLFRLHQMFRLISKRKLPPKASNRWPG